jgi:hypothetical protein
MKPIKAIPWSPRMASRVSTKALCQAGMTFSSLYTGNTEPALGQVLGDPVVLRLMASDRVSMTELLSLLEAARTSVRARSGGSAPPCPDQP